MKAIIIDDEENARIALSVLINDHAPELRLHGVFPSLEEAHKVISKEPIDVVFLDIQMPKQSGFDLWKYFPNPSFHVVFTTAYSEYAIKAIRLSALDYLLKPVDIEELVRVVNKLKLQAKTKNIDERLEVLESNLKSSSSITQIVLPTLNALIVVKISEIVRCESDDNYTRFYLQDKTEYLVSRTLKEYETILPSHTFFRVHQSHLVNINYVKKFLRGKASAVELINCCLIPVSKDKRELFIEKLNNV
jgi:two-component system, LytTR family, response regulator